jgi:serine/threonine protein kinase
MPKILGQGSYGQVSVRNGMAIKKFSKLSHLIQEYLALKYLSDCSYVVHCTGVDFARLEMAMELYDGSLRHWIDKQNNTGGLLESSVMAILRDILLGLCELHDRELAHGDLKPGNVLVSNNPMKVVLGDCGFVSVAKYAKVERTAPVYRDPVVTHEWTHDMYSFGICFLEMLAGIKINRQASYSELKDIVQTKIKNSEYRKIIYNLLHEDKARRPTARYLLQRLYDLDPPKWKRPEIKVPSRAHGDSLRVVLSISPEDCNDIRRTIKTYARNYKINRGKKSYGALVSFIENNNIERKHYFLYTAVTLMIISSMFGESGFRDVEALKLCGSGYNNSDIYSALEHLLSDATFINILLLP